MLSRFVMPFLPKSNNLLISWLQSPSVVIWSLKNIKPHCFHCFPIYLPWSDGTRFHDLSYLNVEVLRSWTVLWRPTRPYRTTPQKDILFIIGDWNAKAGSQEIPGGTGKFGLGLQNEAGQRLTEFWQENAMVIANTLFQQHKRRLYTWTSPDGQ